MTEKTFIKVSNKDIYSKILDIERQVIEINTVKQKLDIHMQRHEQEDKDIKFRIGIYMGVISLVVTVLVKLIIG